MVKGNTRKKRSSALRNDMELIIEDSGSSDKFGHLFKKLARKQQRPVGRKEYQKNLLNSIHQNRKLQLSSRIKDSGSLKESKIPKWSDFDDEIIPNVKETVSEPHEDELHPFCKLKNNEDGIFAGNTGVSTLFYGEFGNESNPFDQFNVKSGKNVAHLADHKRDEGLTGIFNDGTCPQHVDESSSILSDDNDSRLFDQFNVKSGKNVAHLADHKRDEGLTGIFKDGTCRQRVDESSNIFSDYSDSRLLDQFNVKSGKNLARLADHKADKGLTGIFNDGTCPQHVNESSNILSDDNDSRLFDQFNVKSGKNVAHLADQKQDEGLTGIFNEGTCPRNVNESSNILSDDNDSRLFDQFNVKSEKNVAHLADHKRDEGLTGIFNDGTCPRHVDESSDVFSCSETGSDYVMEHEVFDSVANSNKVEKIIAKSKRKLLLNDEECYYKYKHKIDVDGENDSLSKLMFGKGFFDEKKHKLKFSERINEPAIASHKTFVPELDSIRKITKVNKKVLKPRDRKSMYLNRSSNHKSNTFKSLKLNDLHESNSFTFSNKAFEYAKTAEAEVKFVPEIAKENSVSFLEMLRKK